MKELILKKKKSFFLRKQTFFFFFSWAGGACPHFSVPHHVIWLPGCWAQAVPPGLVCPTCVCASSHAMGLCVQSPYSPHQHPPGSVGHSSAKGSQNQGQPRPRISAILPFKSESYGPYACEAIRLVFCPNCCSLEINGAKGNGVSGSQDVLLGFDLISAFHGPPFCS